MAEAQKQAKGSGWPTVVGIGASAGGLAALKALFHQVPADSGLAFVVVVHLSPGHESHLAELLQPHAKLPVQQVTETVAIEPDRVYVIPPGANLSAIDTHLRLSKLEDARAVRAPIDHFLRTLAQTHDGHSVGVILSGTGSDGTLGLREIKAKGGLVVVQDPQEAEFDGMPRSALAAGVADLVLPLAEIPAAALRFARTAPRVRLAEEQEGREEEGLQLFQRVLALLRARSGRDFSRYKRSAVLRRLTRRMQLRSVEELSVYVDILSSEPEEVLALADDLLITVTNFFRDPEVFEVLATEVLPALLASKHDQDDLRVWSVGCATGEEAYSLAMLLLETLGRGEKALRIQVFASDLHEAALARAREGYYPGDIASDVGAERLERFFHKDNGGYRVRREVRELVVFAPHNLLSNPPFSRLDLVCCRNLLIYLQRDVQRDVIELFHYALAPDGLLVLGPSESIEGSGLFVVEDKRHCIYRKRSVVAADPRIPVFPLVSTHLGPEWEGAPRPERGLAYGAMHHRMLERYAPPSLLVDPEDKVVHLSQRAGRYLVHPGGEVTSSVYKLVREELRIELRAAVHAARSGKGVSRAQPTLVRFEGTPGLVTLHVRPALEPQQEGYMLVIFDEQAPDAAVGEEAQAAAGQQLAHARELDAELEITRQRLQAVIEEYETSQDEMRAANEELQSTNEELRSTLEELETSKEELQSMNEELQTVNQQNRHKVEELDQLSTDLQNLLTATDIATLFLDRDLRILRFTPKVGELFNVRMSDRGRPVSDLTHHLGYPDLLGDARRVLATLIPIEHEVRDERGRWYLTRLLPYRSAEDRIEGVVITLVDISALKAGKEALRESEGRLGLELEAMKRLHRMVTRLLHSSDLAAVLEEVLDATMEIVGAQKGMVRLAAADGSPELVLQRGFDDVGAPELRGSDPTDLPIHAGRLGGGERLVVEDVCAESADRSWRAHGDRAGYRSVQASPLLSRSGQLLGVLSTYSDQPHRPSERDLRLLDLYARQAADYVEYARSREVLREKTLELARQDARKEQFLATLGHELRNPLAALDSALRVVQRGARDPGEVLPMMASHVSQLKTLVNDLLEISRITRGKITLRRGRVNLTRVVQSAAEAVRSGIYSKRQDLVLQVPDRLHVLGDATRLEQVVVNLLSNASKYSPSKRRIHVKLSEQDGQVVLAVRDEGRGLAPEQFEVIFEPFFQSEAGSGGLGIGLPLVKSLVELHEGTIQVESPGAGRGCTFTVRLPVGDVPADEGEDGRGASDSDAPLEARVLLIDDARDSADMLALLLRISGAETFCAYTGAEGLEKAESWRPDVALVDIGLPDMTGYEVAEHLRAQDWGREMLVLAITGYGDAQAESDSLRAGFAGRLLKPVDHDRLRRMIREHVQRTDRSGG